MGICPKFSLVHFFAMFFTFGDFWGENVNIPKYTDVQEYIGVKITYFFFRRIQYRLHTPK